MNLSLLPVHSIPVILESQRSTCGTVDTSFSLYSEDVYANWMVFDSTKGRLIVLCLERTQNSYGGPTAFFRKAGSFSQCSSPFRESVGYASEHLSSSSFCSSEDDINCEGIKLEESEVWQLRLAYSTIWTGMVLAVCPYLDHLFLASAGNAVNFMTISFACLVHERTEYFWALLIILLASLFPVLCMWFYK